MIMRISFYRFRINFDSSINLQNANTSLNCTLQILTLLIVGSNLLRQRVGVGGMWIEKLLGDLKFIKYTLEFVQEMQRFDF